ncbi:MAG: hypothetical protein COA80_08615 [Leeuwenhoekiella sp.]|nr:MAG: hypothetical protein COA80_08615 [Leeuwenhoekiella sp.]
MGKIVEEYITDWAYTKSFTHIHISQAESGKMGYFCLGCKKEMQAVKGKIREHYFRHHAKDVKNNYTECVRANKEYREHKAREILHRLKRLKVPAVYKYPPRGSDGLPNKLSEAKWVEATTVKSELTFYEDENCEIKFGSNRDIEERFMPIRPDITFFDAGGRPILFIEFVVTHKIDERKKNKLYRFGINTVQIIIPKKSEEEIEQVFKSSRSIKWVYNEIEANTEYIYVSDPSGGGVWEIDDDQRKLFEESYRCRKNQIANLIRSVRNTLESESYKGAERHFEQEISRVKKATEAERAGLESMEERVEGEVRDEFSERREQLESEGKALDEGERKFRGKKARLDKRYQSKKQELETEQERADNFEQLRGATEERSAGVRERIEENIRRRDNIEERVFQECRSELNKGDKELPRRTKAILEAQRVLSLYPDVKREEKQYKAAQEFLRKGTWQAR